MGKKTIVVLMTGLALASVRLAEAQQPGKVRRIGVLIPTSPSFYPSRIKAFQQGLRDQVKPMQSVT
jgi:hypothetical protein